MSKYYYEISLRNHVDDEDDDLINDYIELDDSSDDLVSLEAQILAANTEKLKDFTRCEIIFIDKIVKETN